MRNAYTTTVDAAWFVRICFLVEFKYSSSAAFTAKAAAWTMAQASGNGLPQTMRDTPKGVQKRV